MGRGTKKDVPKSMCLLSMLYDPVNYLNLDVQMGQTDAPEPLSVLHHGIEGQSFHRPDEAKLGASKGIYKESQEGYYRDHGSAGWRL